MITLQTKRTCPAIPSLTSYALSQGWVYQQTISRRADNVELWDTYHKDGHEVYIPAWEGFSDYEYHCLRFIRGLADYEQRDTLDIYNDIVGAVILPTDKYPNDGDNLRLCQVCGQYECVAPATKCWRCREQDAIDREDWLDDN